MVTLSVIVIAKSVLGGISVSVALLLARLGSGVSAGLVMEAVLMRLPTAEALIVATTV